MTRIGPCRSRIAGSSSCRRGILVHVSGGQMAFGDRGTMRRSDPNHSVRYTRAPRMEARCTARGAQRNTDAARRHTRVLQQNRETFHPCVPRDRHVRFGTRAIISTPRLALPRTWTPPSPFSPDRRGYPRRTRHWLTRQRPGQPQAGAAVRAAEASSRHGPASNTASTAGRRCHPRAAWRG